MKTLKLRVSHYGKWIVESPKPLPGGRGIRQMETSSNSHKYYFTQKALDKLELTYKLKYDE